MIPGVPGSVGGFPLLIFHVGSSLLEEGIECPQWSDANEFSELSAREEAPLEQVSLYMIGSGDLDGLAVEPINKFPDGLVVSLDDSLEGCFNLWMSMRSSKQTDELVLQISLGGD